MFEAFYFILVEILAKGTINRKTYARKSLVILSEMCFISFLFSHQKFLKNVSFSADSFAWIKISRMLIGSAKNCVLG